MPSAHAKYSPSSLKSFELCPSWRVDKHAPTHPVAELGTLIHRALEEDNIDLLEEKDQFLFDTCVELREALRPDGKITEYLEMKLDTGVKDCWGTADIVWESGHGVHIVDYKTGFNLVEHPEDNAQALAYSIGAFERFQSADFVSFSFVYPRFNSTETTTFFRKQHLPSMKSRLHGIIARARVPKRIREVNPVADACRYCGLAGTCKAMTDRFLPLASAAATNEDALPVALRGNSWDIKQPVVMGNMLKAVKVVGRWADGVKSAALKMRVDQGMEIPGWELTERVTPTAIKDPAAAARAAKAAGLTTDEILDCCKVSYPKLVKKMKAHAPRGFGDVAVADLDLKLSEADAVEPKGDPVVFLKETKKRTETRKIEN